MTLRDVALAASFTIVAGCTSLQPAYERPASPVAAQWHPTAAATGQPAIADIPWETFIADPALRELVSTALSNNRDLRIAALNIEKARAQYDIQRSEGVPQVDLGAGGTAQRTPASVSTTGNKIVSHAYTASVGVSAYELDLFGRVRSLRDEALQQYLATEEARRSTHLSLVAAVITAYLNWTADAEQVRLAEDTVDTRKRSYELQRKLQGVGSATRLSVRQAEGELDAARAQALVAHATVATDRNALELLLGHPLAADAKPAASIDQVLAAQVVPTGLSSDVLLQRPDILASEHALIGANADIGAARAAFFPSITLTGSAGLASDALSSLFKGPNVAWSFAPRLNLPIFTGGRLRAALEVAQVDRDIAVADYERDIQAAFREVADGLALMDSLDQQLQVARRRVDTATEAHAMVEQRYRAGVATYLEVLDAQRTLLSTRDALIGVRLSRQANLVTLYKALGGGWTQADADRARSATSSAAPGASPKPTDPS